MKTPPRLLALLLLPALVSLPAGSAWSQQREALPELKSARVVERGSHHAKWETVQEVADPLSGETVSVTNSYVQLETGLHYQDERGEWQASSEEIEVQPGAAVARRGPHQVRWAANLNTYGAIEFWTPEGEAIRSHVLGLAYFDPATGAHVMVGEVQDSVGAVAGNQVIYEDAFGGVSADLHYTYTKGGFVQDVIVREKLPDPALWGFDPATVQVQVLTEFVALPEELKELARTTSEASAATNALTGSLETAYAEDQALNFGSMAMTEGRAFGVADEAQERAVPVRKRLQLFEGGRNLLLETLDFSVMEQELETLPELSKPTASLDRKSSGQQTAGLRVAPPAPTRQWVAVEPSVNRDEEPLLMARAELPAGRNGYVIDYNLSGSTNNLTLQGNTTYHITGLVTATGTTTIEGGTVVKFASTNNAELRLQGTLACLTASYRPAVFTAKDDNTVGTTISGSTGNPSGYYASAAISLQDFASELRHVHIRHAHRAVLFNWNNAAAQTLSHAQMVKCGYGVVSLSPNFQVRNALLHQVITNFHTTGSGITGSVEHLTSRYANRLNGSGSLTLNVTNSLLVQITNSSTYNNGGGNRSTSSDAGVFQTAGAGESYLAVGSADRDSGVTNISAQLRSDFLRMTTYPPVVLTNQTISVDTVFGPLIQRDSDVPDRGYHYAVLDYAVGDLFITNATLRLTGGVAVAGLAYRSIQINNNGKLISTGTPDNPNVLTRYRTVQEQAYVWHSVGATIISTRDFSGNDPEVYARFSDFSDTANGVWAIYSDSGDWKANVTDVRDSRFFNTGFRFSGYSYASIVFFNNLVTRAFCSFYHYPSVSVHNNTFHKSEVRFTRRDHTWLVKDNIFDDCIVAIDEGSAYIEHDHNGYLNGSQQVGTTQTNDVVLASLRFQAGPLGRFYLPAASGLHNAGSRTASAAGLFHFTTQVDQTKETNSVVDIGHHSAALSSVYAASAGFSGTQGANGWYYQYGSTRGLPTAQLSIYDSGNARWTKSTVAPDMWCRVAAGQQLCAWSFDSFRSFLIPTSGRVAIRGLVWDLQICGGSSIYDGAEVRILRNSATVVDWRGFPEAGLPIPLDEIVDVAAGDYLHFQLSRKTNNSCDETAWNPVISYVTGSDISLPIDTDGDGFADYFEDRNGNGATTPDAGETDWDNVVNQHGPDMSLILFTPLSK